MKHLQWQTMDMEEIAKSPKCPRCDSSETKFCYYNNYSLTQPRFLCKSCRRYWTKGGSLRNIPVGGGCRKNRRSKSDKRILSDRSSEGSKSGSEIDLAVVFANFLKCEKREESESSRERVRSVESDVAIGEGLPIHDDDDIDISIWSSFDFSGFEIF